MFWQSFSWKNSNPKAKQSANVSRKTICRDAQELSDFDHSKIFVVKIDDDIIGPQRTIS